MSVMNRYRSTDNQNNDIISTNQNAYDRKANNLHALLPKIHSPYIDEQIHTVLSTKLCKRSEINNENKQ